MARFGLQIFTWICRIGVGLSFTVLIGTVLIQVVGRTIGASPVWTEELTRFALLYVVGFGTGLSVLSGDLVSVDVVSESLPGKFPWALRLISAALTASLCIYLLPHAWRFVSIGALQTSPALHVRMTYVHFSVFLLLALLAAFSALRVFGMVRGTEDGLPNKAEEL